MIVISNHKVKLRRAKSRIADMYLIPGNKHLRFYVYKLRPTDKISSEFIYTYLVPIEWRGMKLQVSGMQIFLDDADVTPAFCDASLSEIVSLAVDRLKPYLLED